MCRRSSNFLVVLCSVLLFAACGGGGGDLPTDTGTPPTTCEGDSDCATNGICETGSCVEGECVVEIDLGDVCDDGDECTDDTTCQADGSCGGGSTATVESGPCEICECTDAGVTCTPKTEGTTCSDGDCCTGNDKCTGCDPALEFCPESGMACQGTMTDCDDDNQCTVDACECVEGNATCGSLANDDGTACDIDDNDCTEQDTCQGGQCEVGAPLVLSDDNECTFDYCDKGEVKHDAYLQSDEVSCNDGDFCTSADYCHLGSCVGSPVQCTIPPCANTAACDADTGDCEVEWTPTGGLCDDGDACTENEICDENHVCSSDTTASCDDGKVCTLDSCDTETGECSHDVIQGGCDDGNLCTFGSTCQPDGSCVGTVITCNNPNTPCLQDVCNPVTGQCDLPMPDGIFCGDSNSCNGYETCLSGECQDAPDVDCSGQDDPCYFPNCNPDTGNCDLPKPVGTSCDDGDLCSEGEYCAGGTCLAGSAKQCDPSLGACIENQCNPETGLCDIPKANDTPCLDSNLCDGSESCQGGVCSEGDSVDCSDVTDQCLFSVCNPGTGLCDLPKTVGSPCQDGDTCTVSDTCVQGICIPGSPLPCNNSDPCLENQCNPDTGACDLAVADGIPCGASGDCDGAETCQSGVCVPGQAVDCSGVLNECYQPVCNPGTGQCNLNKPLGAGCDDGDLCSVDDSCNGGICVPGADVDCPPDPCASGSSCNPDLGCLYTYVPPGTVCDDNDPCTVNTTCDGEHQCNGTPTCDDGDPCTADSCNPVTGACNHTFQPGTSCSDGSLCTSGDVCTGDPLVESTWSCTGTAVDCSAVSDACLEQECNPLTGQCNLPKPDGTECGFHSTCTWNACLSGSCVAQDRPGQVSLYELGAMSRVDRLPGGNFVILSEKNGDLRVSKVSGIGDLLWTKTFGGAEQERAVDVAFVSGGTIAVLGTTKSQGAGGDDVWLLRLDMEGNLLWEQTFGNENPNTPTNMIVESDKSVSFVYAGGNQGQQNDVQSRFVRVDESGGVTFNKVIEATTPNGQEIMLTALINTSGLERYPTVGYQVVGHGLFPQWAIRWRFDLDGNLMESYDDDLGLADWSLALPFEGVARPRRIKLAGSQYYNLYQSDYFYPEDESYPYFRDWGVQVSSSGGGDLPELGFVFDSENNGFKRATPNALLNTRVGWGTNQALVVAVSHEQLDGGPGAPLSGFHLHSFCHYAPSDCYLQWNDIVVQGVYNTPYDMIATKFPTTGITAVNSSQLMFIAQDGQLCPGN